MDWYVIVVMGVGTHCIGGDGLVCYCSDGRWYRLQWWCWIGTVIVVKGNGTRCNGGVGFLMCGNEGRCLSLILVNCAQCHLFSLPTAMISKTKKLHSKQHCRSSISRVATGCLGSWRPSRYQATGRTQLHFVRTRSLSFHCVTSKSLNPTDNRTLLHAPGLWTPTFRRYDTVLRVSRKRQIIPKHRHESTELHNVHSSGKHCAI
jgi:hypothetical protein